MESQEGYIKKRAQEISVDRIGLLACKDINIASRAITKSLSGLGEKYISSNMQGFLSQLDLDDAQHDDKGRFSSHPSFILRLKALLRFSMSDPYLKHAKNVGGTSLEDVDKLIQNDLNIFIDKDLRQEINDAKKYGLFGVAFAFVKDGSFSKSNQAKLANQFGDEMKSKLIKMVIRLSKDDAINEVRSKLVNAINDFKVVAPNTSKKELNVYLMQIEEESGQSGILNEVIKLT